MYVKLNDMNDSFIDLIIQKCRKLFLSKLKYYDVSWKYLKHSSMTDQILIKVIRIKNIESKGYQEVKEEKIIDTYIDVINYIIIMLIKLDVFFVLNINKISHNDVIRLYNEKFKKITNCICTNVYVFKNQSISSILDKMLSLKKEISFLSFQKLEGFYFQILIETILLLVKKNY
ncbi:DUF1599 domain-containing protein [Blattabacterium cuenoti]|uniref:DUF1599 domain-containing protein n=1 Tax=Blattabacterium cuenoti TaxID=1653831 RepID=UPI001EEBA3F2|nr:DUF1599 domain-containing protein [Blattabacterium cuenoti]